MAPATRYRLGPLSARQIEMFQPRYVTAYDVSVLAFKVVAGGALILTGAWWLLGVIPAVVGKVI